MDVVWQVQLSVEIDDCEKPNRIEMPEQDRTTRQQLLREAEGYLDLVTVFSDRWPPSQPIRDRLVQRALDALAMVESGAYGSHLLYLKGQAMLAMQRYQDAIDPLKEAADLSPDDIQIWLALGWCYKRVGRLDLAIESLEEALASDADQAIVHYNLACYWSLANNITLAVAYLSSALDLEPDYRDQINAETDFDNVRNHPDFLALTTVIV